jgi:pimeloyl-ACP methyl ester carboxylesterase
MTGGDYVVLLHGIFRTNKSMSPVERFLSAKGYRVINVGYPSCKKQIEGLVEDVREALGAHKIEAAKKVHFVGYSLGGLLTRAYIKKYRPENLGRVVQLGPPNQGSEVADFAVKIFLYKYLYGPAGLQLVTDQSRFANLYGPVDYDLGIIAGNRTLDPVFSLLIPGENDGKVSVERTKLPGMRDHIVVAATHTFMPGNKTVQMQAEHFIRCGEFLR